MGEYIILLRPLIKTSAIDKGFLYSFSVFIQQSLYSVGAYEDRFWNRAIQVYWVWLEYNTENTGIDNHRYISRIR